MLKVDDLHVSFDGSRILTGVTLEAREGEEVAILGRNGSGRSTLLRTIMGINHPTRGKITWRGEDLTKMTVTDIAKRGIRYVHEGRRIFPFLTVFENLKIAMLGAREGQYDIEKIYDLFPVLRERKSQIAMTLSGGERQMLTTGCGVITNPDLLLLDEPFEGLAPKVIGHLRKALENIPKTTTILLIDQNAKLALELTDKCYILAEGKIQYGGKSAEIQGNEKLLKQYLAIG
jgi:branched-chain amino acid transport system ATP-binding protein